MDVTTIDAIIFDLGGVILNLDYQKTEDAFIALGLENFKEVYSQLAQSELFTDYETGKISSFHFVNCLLDKLPRGTNANQVVHAWNAMILDFPIEKLQFLKLLKEKKKVFLLSNTNELHLELVRRRLKKIDTTFELEDFFQKCYFSHELGLRKPDKALFEFVCVENDLDPSKTLFLDDTEQHIEGARQTKLNTFLVDTNIKFEDLFSF